jgi:hypothetical protein
MFKFKFFAGGRQINGSLKNHDKITLVIMGKRDCMGKGELVKKDLQSLQEEIRELLPVKEDQEFTVWECSHISHNLPVSSSSLDFSYFYHHLYEGLVAFGTQKKMGFIVVKLPLEEYRKTEEVGAWPYIIQLFSHPNSDSPVYGVLALKGRFYEIYQKQWETWLKGLSTNPLTG